MESRLDFTKRLGRKQGNVRLFWEYETIDREHYYVAPDSTETTTNILGASWWARPKKGVKTNVKVQHGTTDDPFMLVNGQYSTLTSAAVPNPFHPDSAQYYQFHEARIADTTASPSSWNELQLRASRTDGNTTVSGSYRYWDGDNGDGDLTDWARTHQTATISLWSMPAPTWQWHAAYTWSDTELEAPASIPLFDG